MELRGMPAGMTAYFVTIGGSTLTDGWEGSISQHYPSFWVVGGDEFDAIKNARKIIGLEPGSEIKGGAFLESLRVSACQADFESDHPVIAWDSESGRYEVLAGKSPYWDGIIVPQPDGKARGYLRHASGSRQTQDRMCGTLSEARTFVLAELAEVSD